MYDDIRKYIANYIAFLRIIKKDISSDQIRNYPNVLNGLRRLGDTIRSLERILDKKEDETIRRRCDDIKKLIRELQAIVSDSISVPASYIKVTEYLDNLFGDLNALLELLAEERKKTPASGKAGDKFKESWLWKLYEKTIKAVVSAILEFFQKS